MCICGIGVQLAKLFCHALDTYANACTLPDYQICPQHTRVHALIYVCYIRVCVRMYAADGINVCMCLHAC